MRLPGHAIPRIVAAVHESFGSDARVWLFGSRVDDQARGGDIDLYIETSANDELFARRARLRLMLERLLGEQKIDLVTHRRDRPLQPIHRIARRQGIELGANRPDHC